MKAFQVRFRELFGICIHRGKALGQKLLIQALADAFVNSIRPALAVIQNACLHVKEKGPIY
jgi:hypothetical protein